MITIVVHNLYTGNHSTYDITRIYDFAQMALDFGPNINNVIGDTTNIRTAADKVAEYLSNHHMQAEILDPQDTEEIYNPNVELFNKPANKPEQAIDLKDVLESYQAADNIDIPDYHVLNAATHRWGK